MARPFKIRGGKTPRVRLPFWGIVRTPVGREKFARLNIERAGGRTFIPRVQKGYSPILEPLLPGYVFVLIETEWAYLRSTPGIIQILTDRGKPARIQNDVMDEMLREQGEEGFIDLSPPIYKPKAGEMVKVRVGLFKDHLARYVGLTPENRVRAIIDFLGKPQELSLRTREIAKAE
jgi:transcription antitermination factor NusG